MQREIETLSAVTDEGSGVGSADTLGIVFDIHARPVFEKTSRNFLNYFHYDEMTGALVESIEDLDTSWSGLSSLPNASLRPTGPAAGRPRLAAG